MPLVDDPLQVCETAAGSHICASNQWLTLLRRCADASDARCATQLERQNRMRRIQNWCRRKEEKCCDCLSAIVATSANQQACILNLWPSRVLEICVLNSLALFFLVKGHSLLTVLSVNLRDRWFVLWAYSNQPYRCDAEGRRKVLNWKEMKRLSPSSIMNKCCPKMSFRMKSPAFMNSGNAQHSNKRESAKPCEYQFVCTASEKKKKWKQTQKWHQKYYVQQSKAKASHGYCPCE